MRNASILVATLFLGLASMPADAFTPAPMTNAQPSVTLAAGGCGVGFHRGPWAGCRPNGYVRRCFWRRGVRICT
jgi:hypothetical protein